ncbi:MAG: recombinase RecA [Planctomycetia bacterium]|jgi:recombination protein RecA|nr:recombinase RecA [Planctomycetia bacterium]MCC7314641.1 recombinase RecA [Planctomycetota bacterium]OQZ01609.1 MAG: recombinase RecA [Planctomycetes bacterium UTPLA1]
MSSGDGKRQQALDRALQQIEKTYGKGAIMQLDANLSAAKDGISTGALSLDLALGGAGLPRGRIVEIFGPESSGKTTLALHVIAAAQRADGVAAFVDAEHALDPAWMKRCGVNPETLLVSQPDCGEQALEITDMLVRSNAVDVIVVDSVAALTPKSELEGEMGQASVGVQARLMSQGMRKLTAGIAKSRSIVIFINQIREKIGVMFGSPETTPGGRALKFYSSIRIDVRRIASIKEGDKVTGSQVKARVVKNKVAPPFRETLFDIMFDSGISREGDLIELGIKHTLIERQGAWLRYGDVQLGQGKENAKVFLKDNPQLFEEIRIKILEVNGLLGGAKPEAEKDAKEAKEAQATSKAEPAGKVEAPVSKSVPAVKGRPGAVGRKTAVGAR